MLCTSTFLRVSGTLAGRLVGNGFKDIFYNGLPVQQQLHVLGISNGGACVSRTLSTHIPETEDARVWVDHGEKILFSQNWEDINPIRSGLKIQDGDNVFSIAGCGDNIFALLLDNPQKVQAIDISSVQIQLCRLKMAAIKSYTLQEVRDFVGITGGEATPESRLRMYESLRPELSTLGRQFFDENVDEVKNGIMHMGVLEKDLHYFRSNILPLAHTQDETEVLLSSKTLREQKEFFDSAWDTELWGDVWRLFGNFHKSKFKEGLVPQDIDFGGGWISRFRDRLHNIPVTENHFLEYLLTSKTTGRCGLPPYLHEKNFPIIRSRLDRIELSVAEISDYLEEYANADSERFDCLSLSNVSDWIMPDQHDQSLLLAVDCAKSGSRIIWWNIFGIPKRWPQSLMNEKKIEVDKILSSMLHLNIDRSLFFEPPRIARVL